MRCLFFILLFGSHFSFAQARHGMIDSLYETKWYLNLIELYEFGSDERGISLVTLPYGINYLIFSDQLIYGSNHSYNHQKEDDLEYDSYHLVNNSEYSLVGEVYTYDTKRDLRKGNSRNGYSISMNSYGLMLTSQEDHSQDPLGVFFEARHYFYSRTFDSLNTMYYILGSWKIDNELKSMNLDSTDTLSLSKTYDVNPTDTAASITFQIVYGDMQFYHNLEIPEKKKTHYGFAPDPFYVSHRHKPTTFPYFINLEKQQLTLHGDFGSYTFRIVEIDEATMKLVKI